MEIEYLIKDHEIEFFEYPFKCSYAFKHKTIPSSSIQEMSKSVIRPSILVNHNEFVFLLSDDMESLLSFCERNSIPVVNRIDVWGIILEYYLDTEQTELSKSISDKQLNQCGISLQECDLLRKEVAQRMIAYNFTSCLWEWCYLGLYDVLCASIGILSGEDHHLSDSDFKKFYFRAMDIALKGIIMDTQ